MTQARGEEQNNTGAIDDRTRGSEEFGNDVGERRPRLHLPDWRPAIATGPRWFAAGMIAVAALSALSSLWTSGAVLRVNSLGVAADGPTASVSALGWNGPALRVGMAGQGEGTWTNPPWYAFGTSGFTYNPDRVGETVLAFPQADFARVDLAPVLTLSPPVPPGAGPDLTGDGPGIFAREGRVVVFQTANGAKLALPEGLVAPIGDGSVVLVGESQGLVGAGADSTVALELRKIDIAVEPEPNDLNIPPVTDLTALAVAPDGLVAAAGTAGGLVTWFRTGLDDANDSSLEALESFPFRDELGLGTTPILALAMAGEGEGSVIAVAGEDGRVAVLRALPMAEQAPEALPLLRREAFRVGLPPYGFNLVRLLTPAETDGSEGRMPMAISQAGEVAAVWNSSSQWFERYDTDQGALIGITQFSNLPDERIDDLTAWSLAPLVADSGVVLIDAGGDRLPGIAGGGISASGKAVLWADDVGSAGFLPLNREGTEGNEFMLVPGIGYATLALSDEPVVTDVYPFHRGDLRANGDSFAVVAPDGNALSLSISALPNVRVASGRFDPPEDFPGELVAADLSFPTPVEDVVLWQPTGEGGLTYVRRHSHRTKQPLNTGQALGSLDFVQLASRAHLAVGTSSDGGTFDLFDTRNGEVIGRLTRDNADGLIPAPSADGRVVGFFDAEGGLFVIHRTEAPPPAGSSVQPLGVSAARELVRPPPLVGAVGLQLSRDGRVLMLLARDGQLFVGGTDPATAPGFERDNDDSRAACCLHLRPLAPEARFTAAVLTPDGRMVHAVRSDHTLLSLPTTDGSEALTLLHLPGPATALALTRDGGQLAIGLGAHGTQVLRLGRANLLARLGQVPAGKVPAPVARPVFPAWQLPAPTRPGGDVALLGAFANPDLALAARPAGAGRNFSALVRDGQQALLVERLPEATNVLAAARALAQVRADIPEATLHWLAELCPGVVAWDERITCTRSVPALLLDPNQN